MFQGCFLVIFAWLQCSGAERPPKQVSGGPTDSTSTRGVSVRATGAFQTALSSRSKSAGVQQHDAHEARGDASFLQEAQTSTDDCNFECLKTCLLAEQDKAIDEDANLADDAAKDAKKTEAAAEVQTLLKGIDDGEGTDEVKETNKQTALKAKFTDPSAAEACVPPAKEKKAPKRDRYSVPDDQRGHLDVATVEEAFKTGDNVDAPSTPTKFKDAVPTERLHTAQDLKANLDVLISAKNDPNFADPAAKKRKDDLKIPMVYTRITTGEQHDLNWVKEHHKEGVFPPVLADTGEYDKLKRKLMEEESLITSKNQEGPDDYSPYQFSVTRYKEIGHISYQKNEEYQKALKSYVESLFHMSAGAANVTKKEYDVHSRNSKELKTGINNSTLDSQEHISEESQGWVHNNLGEIMKALGEINAKVNAIKAKGDVASLPEDQRKTLELLLEERVRFDGARQRLIEKDDPPPWDSVLASNASDDQLAKTAAALEKEGVHEDVKKLQIKIIAEDVCSKLGGVDEHGKSQNFFVEQVENGTDLNKENGESSWTEDGEKHMVRHTKCQSFNPYHITGTTNGKVSEFVNRDHHVQDGYTQLQAYLAANNMPEDFSCAVRYCCQAENGVCTSGFLKNRPSECPTTLEEKCMAAPCTTQTINTDLGGESSACIPNPFSDAVLARLTDELPILQAQYEALDYEADCKDEAEKKESCKDFIKRITAEDQLCEKYKLHEHQQTKDNCAKYKEMAAGVKAKVDAFFTAWETSAADVVLHEDDTATPGASASGT